MPRRMTASVPEPIRVTVLSIPNVPELARTVIKEVVLGVPTDAHLSFALWTWRACFSPRPRSGGGHSRDVGRGLGALGRPL